MGQLSHLAILNLLFSFVISLCQPPLALSWPSYLIKSDWISFNYFALPILVPSADFEFLLLIPSSKSFMQSTMNSKTRWPCGNTIYYPFPDWILISPHSTFGPQQRNMQPWSSWLQFFKCSSDGKNTSKFTEKISLLGIWLLHNYWSNLREARDWHRFLITKTILLKKLTDMKNTQHYNSSITINYISSTCK